MTLDAFHWSILIGVGIGVLLKIALDEVVSEFKRWRRQLAQERARAMRCEVDDECVAPRGHRGACTRVEYE